MKLKVAKISDKVRKRRTERQQHNVVAEVKEGVCGHDACGSHKRLHGAKTYLKLKVAKMSDEVYRRCAARQQHNVAAEVKEGVC